MSSSSGNSSNSNKNNSSSNSNNTVHQHLHSPSKLTEFARNFEDKPDTLFGRVVNKIQNVYNQSYNTVNDVSSVQVGKSMFYQPDTVSDIAQNSSSSSSSLSLSRPQPPNTLQLRTSNTNTNTDASSTSSNSNTASTAVEHSPEANERVGELPTSEANQQQGRTVSNVLKHISNIVASKNNNVSKSVRGLYKYLLYITL